jgi:ribosomal protein L22
MADAIRGKRVDDAMGILTTNFSKSANDEYVFTGKLKRSIPLIKVLLSAAANAKYKQASLSLDQLFIKKITVDQGTSGRSFKPGAMGRSEIHKKRFSHISVELGSLENMRK